MEKPKGVSCVLFLSVLLSLCLMPADLNVIVSAEEPVSSYEASYLEFWDTQLIDQWGSEGSIAFDSNNNPHVCYFVNSYIEKTSRAGLHYGVWNGTNWNTQTVDPNGRRGVITVDSNNNPHLLSGSNSGYIKHIFWNGSNWAINGIESSDGGRYFDITKDSGEKLYMVYFNRETLEVKYGIWNGSDWVIQVVGEPFIIEDNITPSIVLDSNNNPRIIYNEPMRYEIVNPETSKKEIQITHDVKYAAWNGSDWIVQTVGHNASSTVGSLGNLVMDSKENPHLCYISKVRLYNTESDSFWTKISVNYAYWNGSSWSVHPVEAKPAHDGLKPYISFDSEQKISIYYSNHDSNRNLSPPKFYLNRAQWTGSDWIVETIDSNLTYPDTIIKDSQGKLHLLFDEPLGTIHGAWLFGRLTYATFIGKTTTEPITTWILVPITTVAIVCLGLVIYYKKRK